MHTVCIYIYIYIYIFYKDCSWGVPMAAAEVPSSSAFSPDGLEAYSIS